MTTYGYDLNRQLSSTTFPDGAVETYLRREGGLLSESVDRLGNKVRYGYDAYGRLTAVNFPDLLWPNGVTKSIQYNYEGQKLIWVHDWMASQNLLRYSFTHDALFRVQSEGLDGGTRIVYDYRTDPGSWLDSYTITPPPGNPDRDTTVYYGYGGAGRVSSIGFSISAADVEITYNTRGQYDTMTLGSGLVREYDYDNQGRLTKLSNEHPNLGDLGTYEYRYDYDWNTSQYTMLGQRDRVIVSAHASAQQSTGTTKYRYDANYQLVEEDDPAGGWSKWQYDAIGNRITHQRHYDSSATGYEYWKYAGNPNNSSRLKNVENRNYTYDANGNSLRNAAVWDPLNRLTSMTGSTFTYDWSNRRVKHSTKAFDYVGLNIARERDTTYQTLNDYLFGPGIDEPLVRMDKTGAKFYYTADGLGSIGVELTAAGTVESAQTFDAWGSGTMNSAFGYTGREPAGWGWLYYRARYYEPGVGRFVSEDPLARGSRVDAAALWQYPYTENGPITYVDPFGTTALPCDKVKKIVSDNNQCSSVSNVTVLCIILTESGGDPSAAPPKKYKSTAIGLMQVNKATAKQAKCDYTKLFDPAEAVKCGTQYLCWLNKYYGPNQFSVVGMYNQGPGSGGSGPGADKYKDKVNDCSLCMAKGGCCEECNPNNKK